MSPYDISFKTITSPTFNNLKSVNKKQVLEHSHLETLPQDEYFQAFPKSFEGNVQKQLFETIFQFQFS